MEIFCNWMFVLALLAALCFGVVVGLFICWVGKMEE